MKAYLRVIVEKVSEKGSGLRRRRNYISSVYFVSSEWFYGLLFRWLGDVLI